MGPKLTTAKMPLLALIVKTIPREVRGRAPVAKCALVRAGQDGAVMMTWLRGSHHCTARVAPARGGGYELLYIENGLGYIRSWRCPLDEALLKNKKILR